MCCCKLRPDKESQHSCTHETSSHYESVKPGRSWPGQRDGSSQVNRYRHKCFSDTGAISNYEIPVKVYSQCSVVILDDKIHCSTVKYPADVSRVFYKPHLKDHCKKKKVSIYIFCVNKNISWYQNQNFVYFHPHQPQNSRVGRLYKRGNTVSRLTETNPVTVSKEPTWLQWLHFQQASLNCGRRRGTDYFIKTSTERDRKNRESGSPTSPSLIWGLELEAAVHLLGFHLVVLVHQVQLAVTQSHSFLVLPAHHRGRWQRRRRALLALRLSLREVRSSPGRDAVRWRRPPEVVALFFFAEEVWELVEEQVWGSPLLGVDLAVVDGGGALGLGVEVHVGGSGDEPAAGEQARFVVVQTQRLELGGGAADIRPFVRLVGLVPLDAHLLTVGRRRSVHTRAVIGYSVGGDPWYRCDVTLRRLGRSSSPLRAQVRVVVGLLLVVTLGDLVHRVRGHPGRRLHARHAVTGLAAGVFGAHAVPLPAGGRVQVRLSVFFTF